MSALVLMARHAAAISGTAECGWDCFASLAMTDNAFPGLEMGPDEKK